MREPNGSMKNRGALRDIRGAGLGVIAALGGLGLSVAAASTNLTYRASVTVSETFDSNVFMYDVEPDLNAVPNSVSPFQESFVTAVTPTVGLGWKPAPEFNLDVSYAPEVVFYHAEPVEDHVRHLGRLNANGNVGGFPWRTANMLKWVQGSTEGLYFGGEGGLPAVGGVPIRDRRAQFVYLGDLNVTWELGKWFFRPLANAYYHDFHTTHRSPVLYPGYENYIDRREFNAGFDLGHALTEQSRVYVGYRYGQEIQGKVAYCLLHHNSEHHRPVVGIEGQPLPWLKANGSVGPDIHFSADTCDPLFERNYTAVWADLTVTLLPTTRDSLTLIWKQNTQPAFAASSVYDDIVYDGAFKHQFDERWSAAVGARLYIGDWFAPVVREDWIYSVRGSLTYRHDAHWTAELGYTYEWSESKVPNTPAREYTRHLVGVTGSYAF